MSEVSPGKKMLEEVQAFLTVSAQTQGLTVQDIIDAQAHADKQGAAING